MKIKKSNKEKTALSILLGLRQKFARAKKNQTTYSASELHVLFSEVIRNINLNSKYLDTLQITHSSKKPRDKVWGEVDDAIKRSKIKRYNWNKVFGKSLTQEILCLKKAGLNIEDAYNELIQDIRIGNFIDDNPKSEKKKILENLKISVHARYGENNTAKKVMEAEDE